MLGVGPTSGINGSFGSPEKNFSINFSKARSKFVLVKFKADNKNVNFPTQFCLKSISSGFGGDESTEVFFKRHVYDFSLDYNANDKSDIVKIHNYLMVKNNIK